MMTMNTHLKFKDRILIAIDVIKNGSRILDPNRTDLECITKYSEAIVCCNNTYIKLSCDGANNAIAFEVYKGTFKNPNIKMLVLMDRELFYKAPEYVRDFIVYHELGHYHNGHMGNFPVDYDEKRFEVNASGKGEVMKQEREADIYAYKKVGFCESIDALNWMIDHYNGCIENRNELILRKEIIQQVNIEKHAQKLIDNSHYGI